MGCNGSKQEDVQKDRKRLASSAAASSPSSPIRERPPAAGGNPTSSSRPVGAPVAAASKAEPVDDIYGKSQTEKRLEETDFLKGILERTQHNFIEIARQKPTHLDAHDAADRQAAYADVGTAVVTAPRNHLSSLLAIPVPYFSGPQAAAGAVEAMARSTVTPADLRDAARMWALVRPALDAVVIRHTEPVVVTFADFVLRSR